MSRVLFVLETPVSYRTSWLEHLRATSSHDVHVLYLTTGQPDRPWEDTVTDRPWVHRGASVDLGGTTEGFFPRLDLRIGRRLDTIDADIVIVPGWAHPAAWQAVLWCRRRRRPYGVMFETWRQQDQTPVPTSMRTAIRDRVLAGAAICMPVGERAADFARQVGVDAIQTVHGNTCDSDAIAASTDATDRTPDPTVLFVGRLLPHKGSRLLLDLGPELARSGIALDVIGHGVDADAVESMAESQSTVHFSGPLPPTQVHQRMAAAHVVVVPSLSEPWGVVVHEALAAGTPVVATTAVGSATDLLVDDIVGRVCEPDATPLADACRTVIADADAAQRARCRDVGTSISHRTAGDEFARAIARANAPARTGPARLVIDARTARTGGGTTVLDVVRDRLVPSLEGLDVEVRTAPDRPGRLADHPALPLVAAGASRPEVVLSLSEASNLGRGGHRTIVLARNWNCWTPAPTLRRRFRGAVARRNARIADIVISATSTFAAEVERHVRSDCEVLVVPFGVGEHFRADGPAAAGQYFLCVGDWYPWKSFELAVDAFARLADEHPSTSLRIAGRIIHPDYHRSVMARATEAGIEERIEVLGHVEPIELAALYRGAIATVATSELESFGHPYLEALASGSPLIGRRMPVTEELVGGHAMLCDGSVDEIAAAMDRVVREPDPSRWIEAANHVEAYSWDAYVERLRELIVEAVA